MTKPKTLEQLRADKEQAETQLAQEQHKLERLENRKKYLEQGVQAATSAEAKKITQPSGAATPACFGSTPDQDPKAAKFAVLIPGQGRFGNVRFVPRVTAPPSETPLLRRVSRCVRFFSEGRVCTHFRE